NVIATVDTQVTIEEKNAVALRRQEELDIRQKALETAENAIKKREEGVSKAQDVLNAHKELKSKGFSDDFYLKLNEIATASGSSPDDLLEQSRQPQRIKELKTEK